MFAGKVTKPNFKTIKLDLKGIYYMPKILKSSKLGDAAILKQIIKILRAEKIQTLSSNKILEISLSKGNYTKIKPNFSDLQDIRCGEKSFEKDRKFFIYSRSYLQNNKVIALEGSGGTQKMIKKVKKFNKLPCGIMIKYPKNKQDVRIDLPTVGLATLKQCKNVGIKGLVLKHKLNIFLNKNQSIKFADKNKMFILVK